MNRSFLIAIITIVVFGLPLTTQSQVLLQYEGPLVVGDYNGEASYSYRLEETDTILDGPFQFQKSNLEALIDQEDVSFSITGAFTNNVANGSWRFQYGEFKSESESQLVDYQYRVDISGIQREAYGDLLMGKPHGPWVLLVRQIDKSEVEETLFKSSIEYDNGLPLKSFRIENPRNTLLGRCLRNGLAHDEWSFFANDGVGATESWFFDNGVLLKIRREENDQTEDLEFYGINTTNQKEINLDARFIELLRIRQSIKTEAGEFKSDISSLLNQNAEYYKKIDDILADLGESAFVPAFKVLVEYYPLDSLENAQLTSISKLVGKSKTDSDAILSSTQLSMLRLSDEQAQFLHSVTSELTQKFLNPLEKLIEYNKQGVLDLVDREELIKSMWPGGKPGVSIEIELGEEGSGAVRSFVGPEADRYDFSANNLGSIVQLAEYTSISLDSIQKVLDKKLTANQRQQDLIALEEELINQSKTLTVLIDSLSPDVSSPAKEALNGIKSKVVKDLASYASMEDSTDKLDFGRDLFNCHEHMISLARAIGNLPMQRKEINELYDDSVWNPFISVVMEEVVKKRIIDAYEDIVVPHLLDTVQNRLDCDNAEAIVIIFDRLYRRMLELRDEDTSKLERNLKREQDPDDILVLFGIEPLKGE